MFRSTMSTHSNRRCIRRLVFPRRSVATVVGVVFLAASTSACAVVHRVKHESVPLTGSQVIGLPVKAHLLDGSTIVYRDGVTIRSGRVGGIGTRYDIRLDSVGTVQGIALDSVAAMESFASDTDVGRTLGDWLFVVGGLTACTLLFYLLDGEDEPIRMPGATTR